MLPSPADARNVRLQRMEHVDEQPKTPRFTADEVWRMLETGVIGPDERVQLFEGELLVMSPHSPVHAALVAEVPSVLGRAYDPGAFHVRSQTSIGGTVDTIPEPDACVVRGRARDYFNRLPGADDIVLVVEISYSTLSLDRRKAAVYARAGYATYWLVNVDARQLEVHSAPVDGAFTTTEVLGDDAEVTPPGARVAVRVAELLPDA